MYVRVYGKDPLAWNNQILFAIFIQSKEFLEKSTTLLESELKSGFLNYPSNEQRRPKQTIIYVHGSL